MILRFLWQAILWIGRLVIPGTPPRVRIDPTAPCPACGHRKGTIRTVRQGQKVLVEHACEICEARWYEDPIRDQNAVVIKPKGE